MDKFIIKMMMSDIIFNQHRRTRNLLNCVFIGAQTIILITSLIFRIGIFALIFSWTCLGFVILTCIITDCTWKKSKKELDEIFKE